MEISFDRRPESGLNIITAKNGTEAVTIFYEDDIANTELNIDDEQVDGLWAVAHSPVPTPRLGQLSPIGCHVLGTSTCWFNQFDGLAIEAFIEFQKNPEALRQWLVANWEAFFR